MANPVTEIVYITLKPDISVDTPGPAANVWQETLSTIASQDGYLGLRYGLQLENPGSLMLLIGRPRVVPRTMTFAEVP